MKYDYKKLYNEYWAKYMNENYADIEAVGIIRIDKENKQQFGFHNVFADDQSPYDFCARLGIAILEELSKQDTEYLKVSKGSYVFGCKPTK